MLKREEPPKAITGTPRASIEADSRFRSAIRSRTSMISPLNRSSRSAITRSLSANVALTFFGDLVQAGLHTGNVLPQKFKSFFDRRVQKPQMTTRGCRYRDCSTERNITVARLGNRTRRPHPRTKLADFAPPRLQELLHAVWCHCCCAYYSNCDPHPSVDIRKQRSVDGDGMRTRRKNPYCCVTRSHYPTNRSYQPRSIARPAMQSTGRCIRHGL